MQAYRERVPGSLIGAVMEPCLDTGLPDGFATTSEARAPSELADEGSSVFIILG